MLRRSVLRLLAFAAAALASGALAAKKVETERVVVDPPKDAAPPAANTAPLVNQQRPPAAVAANAPELGKGVEGLPPLVAKMRQRILDAAYSGDMGQLKLAMQTNETPPIFSVNEVRDPIDYLKTQSGDGEGREILAIMTDVLEAGWARVDIGKPQEMYVWPYFAAIPIDHLEPNQLVEVYKILTSSDFEEMKSGGKYTFYTLGIGPDGTWHYFKLND
ncbi:hypothetical protein [Methyloraptor flagellatus]|uniref:Gluconate 2-dehydrogenase subunit 3 family protein n=1 Tax=Methyloraptor flagellatus TaxID=3162530 RepID=A0AAU7X5G1_9HYPH